MKKVWNKIVQFLSFVREEMIRFPKYIIFHPLKGWEEFKDILEISVLAPVNRKKDITGFPKPQEDFLNLVWPGDMSVDEFITKHNKISNDGIKTYQDMHPEYDGESYVISDWNTKR